MYNGQWQLFESSVCWIDLTFYLIGSLVIIWLNHICTLCIVCADVRTWVMTDWYEFGSALFYQAIGTVFPFHFYITIYKSDSNIFFITFIYPVT